MPLFVHLAPEKEMKRIRRSGIKARRAVVVLKDETIETRGVYCMPVGPNYVVTHQWLRELKRAHQLWHRRMMRSGWKRGHKSFVGVYFRVPSSEPAYVGHFDKLQKDTTAGDAAGIVQKNEDGSGYLGFEVFIPRRIEKSEIHKIRHLRQVLGWRYWPRAHGARLPHPVYVDPGSPKSRGYKARLQARWEKGD